MICEESLRLINFTLKSMQQFFTTCALLLLLTPIGMCQQQKRQQETPLPSASGWATCATADCSTVTSKATQQQRDESGGGVFSVYFISTT